MKSCVSSQLPEFPQPPSNLWTPLVKSSHKPLSERATCHKKCSHHKLSQKMFPSTSDVTSYHVTLSHLGKGVSQKGSAGCFDDRVWFWLKEVNCGSRWISSAAPCFKINLIQTMYFCLPLPPTIVKQVSCFSFESLIFQFKVPIAGHSNSEEEI